MARDITTKVRFGCYTVFSFGADEEEGLMDFTVTHEDEPEDYEGRYWYTTLSPDEMEYLAERMLDAVDYYRKHNSEPEAIGLEPAPTPYAGESLTIANTLAHCNGDRKKAAEQLGISKRTLHRKMKQYGLE